MKFKYLMRASFTLTGCFGVLKGEETDIKGVDCENLFFNDSSSLPSSFQTSKVECHGEHFSSSCESIVLVTVQPTHNCKQLMETCFAQTSGELSRGQQNNSEL